MFGWHHRLNGHEFEQTPGDGEGQGSLVLQSMGSQRVGHDLATEQQVLSYWIQSSVWSTEVAQFIYFTLINYTRRQNLFQKHYKPMDFLLI